MGRPFAIDWGAVLAAGEALGVDVEMLADVLPAAETAILASLNENDDVASDGQEGGE